MDPETRENVRLNWLDCLYHFASPNLQQLWVTAAEPGIIVTFVECMCCYFDDCDLTPGLDAAVERGLLAREETEAIAQFHALADSYDPPSEDDADVLADPNWQEVVAAAQQAWHSLRAVITDSDELDRMACSERRWGEIPRGS